MKRKGRVKIMAINYAQRMQHVEKSIIREILKAAGSKEVISFAGGLPRPDLFPKEALQEACAQVLQKDGKEALQYCTTQGYVPLRQWIAKHYEESYHMHIPYENILITNGSQQGLDLISKVFIDSGDKVLMEQPGYLGAIQAMNVFGPTFQGIPLEEDGINIEKLQEGLKLKPKLFYTVPDFQNPSGITYSKEKREQVAKLMEGTDTLLVEDNPYGNLRFEGEGLWPISSYMKGQSILLGSFSKIVAPGLRIGWICADKTIMDQLISVKQAADLHTNNLSQRMIYHYLMKGDFEEHLSQIRKTYKYQKECMIEAIKTYFPKEVTYTKPEGGMFLWVTLPHPMRSEVIFQHAIKEKVAFVPGRSFYVNGGGGNTLRLNFSNCQVDKIEEGIKRLGKIFRFYMDKYNNNKVVH